MAKANTNTVPLTDRMYYRYYSKIYYSWYEILRMAQAMYLINNPADYNFANDRQYIGYALVVNETLGSKLLRRSENKAWNTSI